MRDQALWTLHIVAGLVILLLLGLHMGIMHFDAALGIFSPAGGHPIDWDNVVSRARSIGFTITYVLLLAAALYHGLYGLRTIIFELGAGPRLRRAVGTVLTVVGCSLLVLGTWAAWASFRLASGV